MVNEIILNEVRLNISNYQHKVLESSPGKKLQQVSFTFLVKSEEYHEIAVLLYEREFRVTIPENDMSFRGIITNYATSITNLYKENAIGEYSLELTEVPSE